VVDEDEVALYSKVSAYLQTSTVEVLRVPSAAGSTSYLLEKDLWRLSPNQWGNDEIVNAYFSILQNEDNIRSAASEHSSLFFNSHFASKFHHESGALLEEYGDVVVRLQRWLRGSSLRRLGCIYIPVKTGLVGSGSEHWYLVVVHVKERIIKCSDSLAVAARSEFMSCVRAFLKEAEDKDTTDSPGGAVDSRPWVIQETVVYDALSNLVTPQQSNGVDCAFFTLAAAEFTSNGLPLLYSQAHVATLRQRVTVRLFAGLRGMGD
jgi:Ulp1 family protease